MNDKAQTNSREDKLQGMLNLYLQANTSESGIETGDNHLDDDSLSTFVEGNLSEREAVPIVSHLTACSYCRHISSELVKLSAAFEDDAQPVVFPETAPTKVSNVLSEVLSKIFGTSDSAVFAHNEEKERDEKEDKEDKED